MDKVQRESVLEAEALLSSLLRKPWTGKWPTVDQLRKARSQICIALKRYADKDRRQ